MGFIFYYAMKRVMAVAGLLALMVSCARPIEADKNLSPERYDLYMKSIAPFSIKKPDQMAYADRTNPANRAFYELAIKETKASIEFFVEQDTAKFFFYRYKDLSSLYEHYRGLGGYFRVNDKDSLVFINFLYHTPRLTAEEMKQKGPELFREMIETGNVNKYLGNREYIHTPNADFYYDTKRNRWDYTENSSWNFLKEEQQRVSKDTAR